MTQFEAITKARLEGWEKVCNKQECTPLAMIIFSPVNGNFELITTEEMKEKDLALILKKVANGIV